MAAAGLGERDDEKMSAHDATDWFYDLSTRLSSQQKSEKRLLEILDGAGKVGDLIRVERDLNTVR